jgi:hypothetical protein
MENRWGVAPNSSSLSEEVQPELLPSDSESSARWEAAAAALRWDWAERCISFVEW